MSWKLNASLTQKDTMDRGAWIKIQKERHEEDSKDKSPKRTKKCKMAWEWGTNEYFCLLDVTIMWCPSWKLPKDRGKKWNSYFWPWKTYLDFETLVSIFLNRTTLNDSKFMYLPFGKSIHLEEFNMLVLLSNSLLIEEEIVQRSGFTR